MLNVVTKIIIVQSGKKFPERKKTITFNFVNRFEITSSWEELTDTAMVTLPKNLFYIDPVTGKKQPLFGTNIDLGNGSGALFMKGDMITIAAGYEYKNKAGNPVSDVTVLFNGYITEVGSKTPFTLQCEDAMYMMKQIAVPNKVWPSAQYTLNQILTECLQGSGYTVSAKTDITLKFDAGNLVTSNETVADVLARIRRQYHLPCFFRGTELRVGYPIYDTSDDESVPVWNFTFQKNIIADEIMYRRVDDLNLSEVAYSVDIQDNGTTKDGQKKTKKMRFEVLVTAKDGVITATDILPGQSQPAEAESGERYTTYYPNIADYDQLAKLAAAHLQTYYYTGFRGKFTTFGIPFVAHGDSVHIVDPVIPDREGTYKVKRVVFTGGVEGLRQDVHLDYLIPTAPNP